MSLHDASQKTYSLKCEISKQKQPQSLIFLRIRRKQSQF